ncbi:MAG: DUF2236 domain-containing protein, partial [Halioglobus sp.]|nr:DUF2236 domain-containing protein [Halioglobus sp.]
STAYRLGSRIPGLAGVLDRQMTQKLARLLESYGHADFITDASQYKMLAAD